MSDAVMPADLRDKIEGAIMSGRWVAQGRESPLDVAKSMTDAVMAALAASPSVGGWENDPYLATDLALVNDLIYQHGGDAALAGWVRLCRRITAAPPSVSTGSRPQEAVPTCDAEAAVVGPGGWLIKDFADGWFWTGQRIAAVAALTEGHSVFDIMRGEYASTPQPAEGCSSNEGAAAWDREICTGCTSSLSIADIKARGIVSCCPDRHMVRIGDLVDAYTARPPRILPQTEKGS